jgi:hypothetical protein
MTDIVQFGLISYAHLHTPRYAAAIGAHPQANLAGIATLGANPHVARAEATRLNLPYYEDYRKLLEQAGLQAVYLGCEPHHHREVILAAAQRNIHVLCDKPLATNLPDEKPSSRQLAGMEVEFTNVWWESCPITRPPFCRTCSNACRLTWEAMSLGWRSIRSVGDRPAHWCCC